VLLMAYVRQKHKLAKKDKSMNILTCNIRCFGAEDGKNNWVYRKKFCVEVMEAQSPDIICFQEMWAEQFTDMFSLLPGFESYAMVDEPNGRRPLNCIFYRSNAFTRISAGGFWLSETPHVAGSKSWDSACVRLANWIRLEDCATGMEFRVVNTHLDHVSQVAREHQAGLIVEDAGAYPEDYVQILTGDMNCDSRNKVIDIFKAGGWIDTYNCVHGTEDPGHTYHEFLGHKYNSPIGKMDWIFTKGPSKVTGATLITDSVDGKYPSDHYFVSATIIANKLNDTGEQTNARDA